MKRPLLFQSKMPICFCVATLAWRFGYMLFHFTLFTPQGTFSSVFLFQTAVWAVILFFFFLAVLFSSCACVLLAHLSALQCLSAAFLPSVDGLNLSHSCNCPSPLWHSWRCEYAAVSNPAFPLSFASLLYQVENPAGFCDWPANIAFLLLPACLFVFCLDTL